MRFLRLILLLILPACSADGPSTRFSPHTSITVHRSATTIRYIDTGSRIEVAAAVMERDGENLWALKIFVTRNDRNYSAIQSAWSHQRRVPYVKDDRRRIGTGRQEAGHIPLDQPFFATAAHTGFTFELVGLRGRYSIKVPPEAFAEALSLYRDANP